MIRSTGLATAAVLLTGCAHLTNFICDDSEILYVLVQSDPTPALITFSDGSECETPCRVGVIEKVDMTVARTGYKADRRTLTRATPSPLLITLEPVVTDTELETTTLPDIN